MTKGSWALLSLVALLACGDDAVAPDGGMDGGGPDGAIADGGGRDATPIDATGGDAGVDAGFVPGEERPVLTRAFRGDSVTDGGCIFTSPLWVESRGEPFVVGVGQLGAVVAFDPSDGREAWRVELPGEGLAPLALSTPAVVGARLVVAFYRGDPTTLRTMSHHLGVIDLEARAIAADFEDFEIDASLPSWGGESVEFFPPTQVVRGTVTHTRPADLEIGLAYVAFGGPQTIHPWHGWLFEIDLDAWRRDGPGAALTGAFTTTAERNGDCGIPGTSGGREALCGGGLWTHAGPQIVETATGHELLVAGGNGQLNLAQQDYASTVMRLPRGLDFDPECDMEACAEGDPADPSEPCMESCQSLFVPRLRPGDPPLEPGDGSCDGMTFQQCYAFMDMDLGSCAPRVAQVPGGPRVVLQCGKDGSLYMFDADHFGLLYDRHQMVDLCGTEDEPCPIFWLGQAATQPEAVEIDGELVVMVNTNQADRIHSAGIVAMTVEMIDGAPRLSRRWEAPPFASADSVTHFRTNMSRMVVAPFGEAAEPYVWVVERRPRAEPGTIWGVRVRDGLVAVVQDLEAPGQKFFAPLLVDDVLYGFSCDADRHDAPVHLYGWRIDRVVED